MVFTQGRLLTLGDTGLICAGKRSKITLLEALAFNVTQTKLPASRTPLREDNDIGSGI